MAPENQTALITGASSGIGLHLAHEFARHKHPVVIVAPVQEELEAVAREIRAQHHVDVRVIAKDLEQSSSAQEIFDELTSGGIPIDILVNNAGRSAYGKSWEVPLEDD